MKETPLDWYEWQRDRDHSITFDLFGAHGKEILEMLVLKSFHREETHINLLALTLHDYERLPFGVWVKGREDCEFALKAIVKRIKGMVLEQRKVTEQARSEVVEDMSQLVYSEWGYVSLKYKMERSLILPHMEDVLKKYQWLLRLAQGKIYAGELHLTDIKAIPIPKIFGQEVQRGQGGKVFYNCPLHTEKSPSFCWYKDQNSWYCYGGCAKGGNGIDLYRAIHNVRFSEAYRDLKAFIS